MSHCNGYGFRAGYPGIGYTNIWVFNCDFQDHLTHSRFNSHKMSLRYQVAISHQALIIWNDIPLTVRNSLTTTNFKKTLKLYFLSLN